MLKAKNNICAKDQEQKRQEKENNVIIPFVTLRFPNFSGIYFRDIVFDLPFWPFALKREESTEWIALWPICVYDTGSCCLSFCYQDGVNSNRNCPLDRSFIFPLIIKLEETRNKKIVDDLCRIRNNIVTKKWHMKFKVFELRFQERNVNCIKMNRYTVKRIINSMGLNFSKTKHWNSRPIC